jgi:hypothetical protein
MRGSWKTGELPPPVVRVHPAMRSRSYAPVSIPEAIGE